MLTIWSDVAEAHRESTRRKTKVSIRKGDIKCQTVCQICGADKRGDLCAIRADRIACHHITYRVSDAVAWLCLNCHADIHERKNGTPRSLWQGLAPIEINRIAARAYQQVDAKYGAAARLHNRLDWRILAAVRSCMTRAATPRELFPDEVWFVKPNEEQVIEDRLNWLVEERKQMSIRASSFRVRITS